jgi:hypothetical protein
MYCVIEIFVFTLQFKVLLYITMESKSEYFEDLRIIKKVMEESSRFLSLSGLSGLFAGLIALAGAAFAIYIFLDGNFLLSGGFFSVENAQTLDSLKIKIFVEALIVLVLALGVSFFFSYRRSEQKGLKMWTPVSKRLLVSLFVPLITGGFLILILYLRHQWQLIIPSMLIFYGLGLVNAGKFTFNEIFYLGLLEITTGLLSVVFPVYGIILWCLGFGLLHIVYGLVMYRKYER